MAIFGSDNKDIVSYIVNSIFTINKSYGQDLEDALLVIETDILNKNYDELFSIKQRDKLDTIITAVDIET